MQSKSQAELCFVPSIENLTECRGHLLRRDDDGDDPDKATPKEAALDEATLDGAALQTRPLWTMPLPGRGLSLTRPLPR